MLIVWVMDSLIGDPGLVEMACRGMEMIVLLQETIRRDKLSVDQRGKLLEVFRRDKLMWDMPLRMARRDELLWDKMLVMT